MDPGTVAGAASSVINSTLRISQIVYEFKAVGEQARDLLASTKHVAKAIETTRTLRRQKSAHLASTEKEWIDSTIEDAERTLNNVAALVEPVRVDMQTKVGKIGLVNRGMFVFRDNPKVLTHQSQLNMTHVSLVNALNILMQRQAQLLPAPSPALDRRASYATLPRPPTYEESEFLNRRRGKLRPKSSGVSLVEEATDMAHSIIDDGQSSEQASHSARFNARLLSPLPPPVPYIEDEKCLLNEIVGSAVDSESAADFQDGLLNRSAVELDAGPYKSHPPPKIYQAYCPDPSYSTIGSQHPQSSGMEAPPSLYANSHHSMPSVPVKQRINAPITPRNVPETILSSRDAELHFPQTPFTPPAPTSSHSSNSFLPHLQTPERSLFLTPSGRASEMSSPKVQQTPPYPDHIPTVPCSYTPYSPPSPARPDAAIGLGVRLPSTIALASSNYHGARSYPGPPPCASTPTQLIPPGSPADTLTTQAPLERSISHDMGSLSRRRRYQWLEHHAGA